MQDSFSYSLSRVNAFKGLASPAYIALASNDPMVFSLALSKELMDLAFVEKEFKNEYFRLAEQCRSFSVSLLGLCWSDAEVRVILNGNTVDNNKRNSIQ